ncbi:MAG: hypothetical protein WCH76_06795, partial [Candidatus Riflemargulisbacteria bacterium]
MATLYRQRHCNNWYARFKNPNGIWIARSTGTDNRREAEQIAITYERAGEDMASGVMIEKRINRVIS